MRSARRAPPPPPSPPPSSSDAAAQRRPTAARSERPGTNAGPNPLPQCLAVLPLVVRPVVARPDRLPPVAALLVPRDGALQPLVEVHLRLPAQGTDLLRAERVAAVVAGAGGDALDEGPLLAPVPQEAPDHVRVRALVRAPPPVHPPPPA